MGFSYQKAKFVADHKDPENRKEWLDNAWPEILRLAKAKKPLSFLATKPPSPNGVH